MKNQRAVVVLSNSQNPVDDIALHILHPERPLYQLK